MIDLQYFAVQLLNGLVLGVIYFLAASGLSVVFGLTDVANFAHGGTYMLGAYVGVSVVGATGSYWLALLVAPLTVGCLAAGVERVTLSRMYDRDPNFQLILTYGLLLCVNAVVMFVWGRGYHSLQRPSMFREPVVLGPLGAFPSYRLFVALVGVLLGLGIWFAVNRTDFGLVLRASVQNKDSLELLGIDTSRQFTIVFAVTSALAAVAGVLVAPFLSIYPEMGNDVIITLFVVIVIGGLGSVRGSVVAALLVGVVEVLGNAYVQGLTGVLVFLLAVAVLVVRPKGILGEYEVTPSAAKISLGTLIEPVSISDPRYLAVVGCLALVPLGVGELYSSYHLGLLSLVFVWGILAISLDLVMGYIGLVSFGHALFFGVGAYATALFVTHVHQSFLLAVAVSVVVTAAAGWLVGEVSNHLDGVYFAIITLSVAELVHRAAMVLDGVTGGSNGFFGMATPTLLGVDLSETVPFYYLALLVLVGVYAAVCHLIQSPFGKTVAAIRESEQRAVTLGCNVRTVKRRLFALSGAIGGLAGSLLAVQQTFVSPGVLNWTTSGNLVAITLFGGIGSLVGPIIGAGVFVGLSELLASHFQEWRLLFGVLVVVTIVASPRGVVRVPLATRRSLRAYVLPQVRMAVERATSNWGERSPDDSQ